MESKLPGPAVKAGGMRITQDKHQRHETETETPKSLLETGTVAQCRPPLSSLNCVLCVDAFSREAATSFVV